jgi:hypothetical protein
VGLPEKAFRPNTALKELDGLYGVFVQANMLVFQKPGVQPVTRKGVPVGVKVRVGVGVFVTIGVFVAVGVGVLVAFGVGV